MTVLVVVGFIISSAVTILSGSIAWSEIKKMRRTR